MNAVHNFQSLNVPITAQSTGTLYDFLRTVIFQKMLNRDNENQLETIISKLKRRCLFCLHRQIQGSYQVTLETAKLLRNVVGING